ncbi:MAG TPA: GNAT family N-acetyltransferase [Sphingobacteriaceae bacterium]|nr:GNAT family N-acetyltransferase [Sphingobacteriaceae bacterium]
MIIRAASINDIALIHRLANEIWWPAYKGVISDEQIAFMLNNIYSEKAIKQQFDDGMKFLISERDGQPTGFAEYSPEEPGKGIFKLHKLYILPSEQGKGTGKKLIERVEELVREQHGNILELNVNRNNPALDFYKKLGFEVWKTVDIPYFRFMLNDYVMRKKM